MILSPIVLHISQVAQDNITLRIYLFVIFIMLKVFIIYEIVLHDAIVKIKDDIIIILEHVIFLSGTSWHLDLVRIEASL